MGEEGGGHRPRNYRRRLIWCQRLHAPRTVAPRAHHAAPDRSDLQDPVIQLHDIRYTIGDRVLFDQLDWVLSPGDRCALVGANGTGKTTLIRLMLGELAPDGGTRVLARGTRLGYLPQEAAERYDGTVLDRALEAHRHLLEMREELDALHGRLQGISPDDPQLAPLLDRVGEVQHHLELHDEHVIEPEARRVLSGLGFSRVDQDRPLAQF